MKTCKSRESFCLSILFTEMIGPLFDMFTGAMFFCEIPKYVQTMNRLAHLDWDFMKVG